MNIRTVQVAGLMWVTDSDGYVKPILKLDKYYGKGEEAFDGITMPIKDIHARDIGVGSRLKVKSNRTTFRVLDLVAKQPNNIEPFTETKPDACPSCGSGIDDDSRCVNDFCQAKSVAQLNTLFKELVPDGDLDIFKSYLREFKTTQSDEPYNIESLIEFLHFLRGDLIHSAGSTGRVGCFPSDDARFEQYEIKLVSAFKSGLTNRQFWKMLNLKGVTEEILRKLEKVDYRLIVSDAKAFDNALNEQFAECFDSMDVLRAILYAQEGLKAMVKTMEELRHAGNKNQTS